MSQKHTDKLTLRGDRGHNCVNIFGTVRNVCYRYSVFKIMNKEYDVSAPCNIMRF